MTAAKPKVEWFGQAGHFIAANHCRFHLHTHVGGWCVSTVGDYHPPYRFDRATRSLRPARDTDGVEEIGPDRTFETMVFKVLPDGETADGELDFRAYNDRDSANAGHAALVAKWARKRGRK